MNSINECFIIMVFFLIWLNERDNELCNVTMNLVGWLAGGFIYVGLINNGIVLNQKAGEWADNNRCTHFNGNGMLVILIYRYINIL